MIYSLVYAIIQLIEAELQCLIKGSIKKYLPSSFAAKKNIHLLSIENRRTFMPYMLPSPDSDEKPIVYW